MLGWANRLALTCTSLCSSSSAVALGNTEQTLKLPYLSLVLSATTDQQLGDKAMNNTKLRTSVFMCMFRPSCYLMYRCKIWYLNISGFMNRGYRLLYPGILLPITSGVWYSSTTSTTSVKLRIWPEEQLFPFLTRSIRIIEPSIL